MKDIGQEVSGQAGNAGNKKASHWQVTTKVNKLATG